MAPDDHTILTEEQDRSEIAEFYRGKTIFITGGTGFLGKILVETLLRCCPGVKKLYLICRPKKGISVEERIVQQFEDPLYDYIKKTQPEALSKVIAIAGEHKNPNLGLNEEDLNTLVNETNVIIHLAATIRFDENLRDAVPINVRSTRDILLLARRMTNLDVFVHVSTAYANCVHKIIEEKFYKPPIDGDWLIKLAEDLEDDMLLRITPGLVGDYPNTYTFTKCVAEDLIRKYSAGLRIALIRPSVVTSVYQGLHPGWNDNINGPVGLGIGIGLGMIHTMPSKHDLEAAFIPANYVINGILAAGWNVGKNTPNVIVNGTTTYKIRELEEAEVEEPSAEDESIVEVYNAASSENPITWGGAIDLTVSYSFENPSQNMIWKPFCTVIENHFLFTIYAWLVHWIPAYLADAFLKVFGRKPMAVKIYKKAQMFQSTLSHFTLNEWTFATANIRCLIEKLSNADKATFPFDVKQIDWKEHVYANCDGARKYLLKESMVPAHRKMFLFKLAHFLLCALVLFLFFKVLKSLFY